MSGCPHHEDAGAYVLGALTEDEHEAYVEHLLGCEICQREVAELQVAAHALPLAAPQLVPPPELRERILSVVRDEAAALAPAPAPRKRAKAPWWRRPIVALGPVPATVLACALLALGVGAGVLVTRGGGETTTAAQVSLPGAPGAKAELVSEDGETRLRVRDFPAPPGDRVYEVWLQRGKHTPVPAGTLFRPASDGGAEVRVGAGLKDKGVARILVSREPRGGSPAPTSAPVVVASLV
jgi:anti-sigma-K factor RskA